MQNLTKREAIAAMALQGILASFAEDYSCTMQESANLAVQAADALLEALYPDSNEEEEEID